MWTSFSWCIEQVGVYSFLPSFLQIHNEEADIAYEKDLAPSFCDNGAIFWKKKSVKFLSLNTFLWSIDYFLFYFKHYWCLLILYLLRLDQFDSIAHSREKRETASSSTQRKLLNKEFQPITHLPLQQVTQGIELSSVSTVQKLSS